MDGDGAGIIERAKGTMRGPDELPQEPRSKEGLGGGEPIERAK